MADTYGALPLDIPTVDDAGPCGDPALRVLADFLKAVINARATTAWQSIAPTLGRDGKDSPVNEAFTHDPEEARFTDKSLPALYLFRSQGGRPQEDGEDYRIVPSTITCWWIYRPTTQEKTAIRSSFTNAIAKIVDDAIDAGRHPSYVRDGDTDTRAPTRQADADAIKTSVATSTSPQTYSGAALDGVIGSDEMDPPRSPTVTLAGAEANFVPGSMIIWTGMNAIGEEVSLDVEITGPGTYDPEYDLVQVTDISVDAQAGTGGTIQFGVAARDGLGTDIYEAAGFYELTATRPTPKIINMNVLRGEPKPYDAFEILFEVQERFNTDFSLYDTINDGGAEGVGAGIDLTIEQPDGDDVGSQYLD